MANVRQAAVAGQFYPADPGQLLRDVDGLLAAAKTEAPCPKVLVAPHAGYIYSGAIAAEVYARLANARQRISRVVLLGPSHRVRLQGLALSNADYFATPLGELPIDKTAQQALLQLPAVQRLDAAHAQEHSLEVQLPFLQRCLEGFSLVPVVVGDASAEQVAAVIDALWGGPETLLVISSDLSHFLDYNAARSKDEATRELIEQRQPTLSGDQACGCRPLNGLLTVLQRRQLPIKTIDLKNSGDTAGTRDRVVGYGAWVVEEQGLAAPAPESEVVENTLTGANRQQLLGLARKVIEHAFKGGKEFNIDLRQYHASLQSKRASFVTLNRNGQLRGCIGNLVASRPLVVDVANNAAAAAFKDPRFKPLQPGELASTDIHISVLSPAQTVPVQSRQALLDYLQPGVHGLILQCGAQRATYLPSVWEKLPTAEQFVSELLAKAGLPRHGWNDAMQVSVYTSEEFA